MSSSKNIFSGPPGLGSSLMGGVDLKCQAHILHILL
jgi:hypothetical protein